MRSSLLLFVAVFALSAQPRQIGGVYPHLAMFSDGGECGTGGVVPWAGKLWVVTYSPHSPFGSPDKLYEIDPSLARRIRPESIGGTPANRMIHRESQQLFIGPYAIDAQGRVRAIPYDKVPGRPTGNARHLEDPANRIYLATMEEGFYDINVHTLEATQLFEDANVTVKRGAAKDHGGQLLPGYHGKGLYSGQGRVVYANNGEIGGGKLPPDIPSGCLAEWDGKQWRIVRRNQFTEVTGPAGLEGSPNPATDPIWSIGWDHRSLILMLLDKDVWHAYRLPKASHTYDGAHGWNTEWPRIRDIGERDLLMTMHGTFWRFPRTFTAANSTGIAPRSTFLRIIGDFARWQDRIVFGADDTAKSEFLNTRKAKGKIAAPGQSQSNLWFVTPEQLDGFGPAIGRGGVWVRDNVEAGAASEPYLFSGYSRRMLHLAHETAFPVTFTLEVDRLGNGVWSRLRDVNVPERGFASVSFTAREAGVWVRVRPNREVRGATAWFQFSNPDLRPAAPAAEFAGLARANEQGVSRGWVWAQGQDLIYASDAGLYRLNGELALQPLSDSALDGWMRQNLAPPAGVLQADAASALYIDDDGRRWRLPLGDPAQARQPSSQIRVSREVVTERDLFNAYGTFYELPSINAGGFAMIRPIATHNLAIHDYCSWRGLTVLSGAILNAPASGRLVRSDDGKAALWLGVADDLWRLGKPRGEGGPWRDTPVQANEPSDPYLMTGFDRKRLTLSHRSPASLPIRIEVDITGSGLWQPYQTFAVPAGKTLEHEFPADFGAYWVRAVAGTSATVTAQFRYD